MRYLSFVRSAETFRNTPQPAALQEAMGELIEKFTREGALVDTGGLAPSAAGFRLRLENGQLTATDGPFTESREIIGGWAILEAASKEEIVRLATEFMELHRQHWPGFEGECEVRPIDFTMRP